MKIVLHDERAMSQTTLSSELLHARAELRDEQGVVITHGGDVRSSVDLGKKESGVLNSDSNFAPFCARIDEF
jgi:hypothetical protein